MKGWFDVIFRSSYDAIEFTRRTLRFNFDDTKETITFINSYCSKILIIDYNELITMDTVSINVGVPIKVDVMNCLDNTTLYLLRNKKDYSKIKAYLDNPDTILNLSSNNEVTQRLLSAIKNDSYAHDIFILASDSQYELNLNKLNSIISSK